MIETSSDLEVDVLIIGSGIAGLTSAIYLLEQNLSVAIVSKEFSLLESNTYWAQGGIIYPVGDKSLQLDEDIQIASHHTSNQESINLLTKYGAKVIDDILLKKAKSSFQRDSGGELSFTREAAHAQSRIIYKDDRTGSEIETSLWNYLNQYLGKGLIVLKQFTALDLITPAHHGISLNHRYLKPQVLGAYLFSQTNNKVIKCLSKKTILATGGIGSIFLHHTNSEGARGDGHAMASRAGAYMINMEFMQFHPTTFYRPSHHRRFLISEALRGEGGIIKDVRGNAFMHRFHVDCELAPRDVVSRAILQHLIENGDEHVLLDISHKDSSWIQKRFPTIYSYCLEQGIDITKDPIPVVPAAHYSCGGIWVDGNGCSSL